jgi:hypothetical protein
MPWNRAEQAITTAAEVKSAARALFIMTRRIMSYMRRLAECLMAGRAYLRNVWIQHSVVRNVRLRTT